MRRTERSHHKPVTAPSPVTVAPPYALVAARRGTMIVNTNDVYMGQALLKYGECCETELEMLLQLAKLPGLVIEVGANMGIHTVPLATELARQGRPMLALEPQPVIFQQLCANLALNGLMNVNALPYACGKTGGMLNFPVPDYRQQGNFGGISMQDATAVQVRSERVPCVRLDDLVAGQPVGLVKVDVEGFELQVLEGAVATLAASHPILYVENDRVAQSESLIGWLWQQGYRLWWHVPPLFNPKNLRGIAENIYGNICSFNMVCLPEGSPIQVQGLTPIADAKAHPLLPAGLPELVSPPERWPLRT